MNIHVQVFVWTYVFTALGHIARIGIAVSYVMVFLCLTFKKLPGCFPKKLHHLHSHQQCMKLPISPYHLLLSVFFITAILAGEK